MYKPELKLSEMIARHDMVPGLMGHGSSPEDSRADSLVSTRGTLAPSPSHAISPTDTMGSSLGVSPVLGGLADEGANKRRRNQLKPYQLRVLNRVLEHTAFPTKEVRDELSRMIHVPPKSIQIWFQNQRQKAKSQMREAKQQQQQPRPNGGDLLPHAKMPIHPSAPGAVPREDLVSIPWQEMMSFNPTPSCSFAVPMQAPASSAFANNPISYPSSDISPFLISPSTIASPFYDYPKAISGAKSPAPQRPDRRQIGPCRRGSRDEQSGAISLPSPVRSPVGSDAFFAVGQLPPLFEEIDADAIPFGLTGNGLFRADFGLQSNYYFAFQGNPAATNANPNGSSDLFGPGPW